MQEKSRSGCTVEYSWIPRYTPRFALKNNPAEETVEFKRAEDLKETYVKFFKFNSQEKGNIPYSTKEF